MGSELCYGLQFRLFELKKILIILRNALDWFLTLNLYFIIVVTNTNLTVSSRCLVGITNISKEQQVITEAYNKVVDADGRTVASDTREDSILYFVPQSRANHATFILISLP